MSTRDGKGVTNGIYAYMVDTGCYKIVQKNCHVSIELSIYYSSEEKRILFYYYQPLAQFTFTDFCSMSFNKILMAISGEIINYNKREKYLSTYKMIFLWKKVYACVHALTTWRQYTRSRISDFICVYSYISAWTFSKFTLNVY